MVHGGNIILGRMHCKQCRSWVLEREMVEESHTWRKDRGGKAVQSWMRERGGEVVCVCVEGRVTP